MEWRIILPVLCLIGILHLPGYVVSQTATPTPTTATTTTTTTTTTAPTTSTTTTTPTTSTTVTTTTTAPTSTTTATTHSSGATTASTASGATTASTASGATTASTASGATTASTASGATTASTASGATTASTASGATTASTASGATTASTASGATTASTASGATTASTASAATTASTAASQATTLPANLGSVNIVFKLTDTFQAVYNDLNNAVTKAYVDNIKSKFYTVYKKRYPNYFGMIINKLSEGSVAADSTLQFDTTNSTTPNATDAKDTLVQAINSGGINLTIDNTSITATPVGTSTTATTIATTQSVATTPLVLTNYTFNFKIPGNFISDLSNINSAPSILLKMFVNYQLSGFLGKFRGYQAVDVWRFRNGSINIDAWVSFFQNAGPPNVTEVAKQLAAAVRNNTFLLPIDPTSINVTDILTGTTANKSPVMVSMLTALWMTLASLLFSAVMH